MIWVWGMIIGTLKIGRKCSSIRPQVGMNWKENWIVTIAKAGTRISGFCKAMPMVLWTIKSGADDQVYLASR